MSFDEWKKRPDGSIAVQPVTGWSTATFLKGMAGGLRIEYALNFELTQKDSVQLVMQPAQVRELAEVLFNMARRMDEQIAQEPRPNVNN